MPTVGQVIRFVVCKQPGLSEREIAERLYGRAGYQQRVNQDCDLLVRHGIMHRAHDGRVYRYFPGP